ncbi:MAG TPA: hypothetical protein VKW08_07700 [Xanthobacteraceae bacterium]|nr:hypothetical protein [Xanthobacteraceae bacterium]
MAVKRYRKLSEASRRTIARRYANGETATALGREFGVPRDRVYQIANQRGARRTEGVTRARKKESWDRKVARLRAEGKITSYCFPA